jgi:hypothetical protein
LELSNRQILIGALLAGGIIWALAPWLTGAREPWDAEGPYYVIAMLGAGLPLGLLSSRYASLIPLAAGLWLGQVAYESLFLTVGPLFWLGLAFLAAYLVPALLSGVVSVGVRRTLSRKRAGGAGKGA